MNYAQTGWMDGGTMEPGVGGGDGRVDAAVTEATAGPEEGLFLFFFLFFR